MRSYLITVRQNPQFRSGSDIGEARNKLIEYLQKNCLTIPTQMMGNTVYQLKELEVSLTPILQTDGTFFTIRVFGNPNEHRKLVDNVRNFYSGHIDCTTLESSLF